jgi:hypothetical protein
MTSVAPDDKALEVRPEGAGLWSDRLRGIAIALSRVATIKVAEDPAGVHKAIPGARSWRLPGVVVIELAFCNFLHAYDESGSTASRAK